MLKLLSEVVSKKMEELNLSDSDVSKLINRSRPYVSTIRNNSLSNSIPDELIEKICSSLKIDDTMKEKLIEEANLARSPLIIQKKFSELKEKSKKECPPNLISEELVLIPVYDFVQAGTNGDSFAFPEPIDYIHYPKKKATNAVGIRVKGDSMEPRIYAEDVVVVRLDTMPENKQTAVFIYNNESILKVYNSNDKGFVMLTSNNSKYQPILITEADELKIVGKVIGLVRDMENE